MNTIKVSDATGLALSWLMAKAQGRSLHHNALLDGEHMKGWWVTTSISNIWLSLDDFDKSLARNDRSIEKEGIATRRLRSGTWCAMLSSDLGEDESASWKEFTFKNLPRDAATSRKQRFDGPTHQIAARRCFVASKLGERVDVPADLLVADPSDDLSAQQGTDTAASSATAANWSDIGRLIMAANSADVRQFATGTSNWAAAMRRQLAPQTAPQQPPLSRQRLEELYRRVPEFDGWAFSDAICKYGQEVANEIGRINAGPPADYHEPDSELPSPPSP